MSRRRIRKAREALLRRVQRLETRLERDPADLPLEYVAAMINVGTAPDIEYDDEDRILEDCPACTDGFFTSDSGILRLCSTCNGWMYIPHEH